MSTQFQRPLVNARKSHPSPPRIPRWDMAYPDSDPRRPRPLPVWLGPGILARLSTSFLAARKDHWAPAAIRTYRTEAHSGLDRITPHTRTVSATKSPVVGLEIERARLEPSRRTMSTPPAMPPKDRDPNAGSLRPTIRPPDAGRPTPIQRSAANRDLGSPAARGPTPDAGAGRGWTRGSRHRSAASPGGRSPCPYRRPEACRIPSP